MRELLNAVSARNWALVLALLDVRAQSAAVLRSRLVAPVPDVLRHALDTLDVRDRCAVVPDDVAWAMTMWGFRIPPGYTAHHWSPGGDPMQQHSSEYLFGREQQAMLCGDRVALWPMPLLSPAEREDLRAKEEEVKPKTHDAKQLPQLPLPLPVPTAAAAGAAAADVATQEQQHKSTADEKVIAAAAGDADRLLAAKDCKSAAVDHGDVANADPHALAEAMTRGITMARAVHLARRWGDGVVVGGAVGPDPNPPATAAAGAGAAGAADAEAARRRRLRERGIGAAEWWTRVMSPAEKRAMRRARRAELKRLRGAARRKRGGVAEQDDDAGAAAAATVAAGGGAAAAGARDAAVATLARSMRVEAAARALRERSAHAQQRKEQKR